MYTNFEFVYIFSASLFIFTFFTLTQSILSFTGMLLGMVFHSLFKYIQPNAKRPTMLVLAAVLVPNLYTVVRGGNSEKWMAMKW